MRIVGVELNDDARVIWALTRIKGIGMSLSKKVMKDLKFDESLRVKDLKPEDVSKIAGELEKYETEGDLMRKTRQDVTRLKTIGNYRGVRHNRGLPVRGQRTRSNARTKRGKRQTVGSFRKEALAKMEPKKE